MFLPDAQHRLGLRVGCGFIGRATASTCRLKTGPCLIVSGPVAEEVSAVDQNTEHDSTPNAYPAPRESARPNDSGHTKIIERARFQDSTRTAQSLHQHGRERAMGKIGLTRVTMGERKYPVNVPKRKEPRPPYKLSMPQDRAYNARRLQPALRPHGSAHGNVRACH